VQDARAALAQEPQVQKYHILNLQDAIAKADGTTIRHYLAQGGDPNVQDRGGYSPLHFAARHCQPDIVRALIASGANPNALDNNGVSPLCYGLSEYRTMTELGLKPYAFVVFTGSFPASENDRYFELVTLLLEAGAHVSGLNEPFDQLRAQVDRSFLLTIEHVIQVLVLQVDDWFNRRLSIRAIGFDGRVMEASGGHRLARSQQKHSYESE
jgi:hypothetical protein